MKLGTPRSEQGQIVEYGYGWHEGNYYMRVFDRSDRSQMWYRASARDRDSLLKREYDAGGANFPPPVKYWMPCRPPSA